MINRRYSELSRLVSFQDRFDYLKLSGDVGRSTFGFDRYVNQTFYRSREWHDVRDYVLVRDQGRDLGIEGYEIQINPLIHHMNPMSIDDIRQKEAWILDPEFLITTTQVTHNAIHYGTESPFPKVVMSREPGDTKLW